MSSKGDVFGKSLTSVTRIFQIAAVQFFTLTNSKENKEFGHKGTKVAKKFVLIFLSYTSVVTVAAIILASRKLRADETMIQKVNNSLTGAVWVFELIYYFGVTTKTKLIYRKFEYISKIFAQRLKIDCDWIGFSRRSKKHFMKFYLISLMFASMIFVLMYIYQLSRIWYLLLVYLFYIIASPTILNFIFFIRLLNHNFQLMKKVLERLNNLKGESEAPVPVVRSITFRSANNIFSTIAMVKDIYGKLIEVADLINSVSAPIAIASFFIIVVGNSLAGYRCFLFLKGDVYFGEVLCKFV